MYVQSFPKQVIIVVVRGIPLPVLVALRDIQLGESLMRDYGDGWWQEQSALHEALTKVLSITPAAVLYDPPGAAMPTEGARRLKMRAGKSG